MIFSHFFALDGRGRHSRSYADFAADFRSKLWFSYRRNFEPLYQWPRNPTHTDAGWGCMLRAGQMLLAETFLRHFLQRDWRLPALRAPRLLPRKYFEILSLFADRQSRKSLFSIHNMASAGEQVLNLTAGRWYGPTPVAQILQQLLDRHSAVGMGRRKALLLGHRPPGILVSTDGIVSTDEVHSICSASVARQVTRHARHRGTRASRASGRCFPRAPLGELSTRAHQGLGRAQSEKSQKWCRALLVIVPVRLGLDRVCVAYSCTLSALLRLPQSVGFIGGKPGHALYFVGTHGAQNALYLDPHTVHVSPGNMSFGGSESDDGQGQCGDAQFAGARKSHAYAFESYHCQHPRSMVINSIDPSLAIGFYCRNIVDFCDLCARVDSLVGSLLESTSLPIFRIV